MVHIIILSIDLIKMSRRISFSLKGFCRGHTDLNHGPIGLQPIALPLSYIPNYIYYQCFFGDKVCLPWTSKDLIQWHD